MRTPSAEPRTAHPHVAIPARGDEDPSLKPLVGAGSEADPRAWFSANLQSCIIPRRVAATALDLDLLLITEGNVREPQPVSHPGVRRLAFADAKYEPTGDNRPRAAICIAVSSVLRSCARSGLAAREEHRPSRRVRRRPAAAHRSRPDRTRGSSASTGSIGIPAADECAHRPYREVLQHLAADPMRRC